MLNSQIIGIIGAVANFECWLLAHLCNSPGNLAVQAEATESQFHSGDLSYG